MIGGSHQAHVIQRMAEMMVDPKLANFKPEATKAEEQRCVALASKFQGAGAACDRCDFTSMCPFDRAAGTYREIPKMSRDDALAAMAEALGNA